jgi:hypothetical protein
MLSSHSGPDRNFVKTVVMKAAIINSFGEIPQYREFPDPVPAPSGAPIIPAKNSSPNSRPSSVPMGSG